VGVAALSAGLAEQRDTVEEVIEPYLIQLGLVARTERGRVLNDGGWQHLGMARPNAPGAGHQPGMFDENG
jgi:Holliday junction DNA helicase RuvB